MNRSPTKAREALPAGYGVIWTTVAVDLVGFGIVVPILPQYAERFGVSGTVIGLLFASFSLAQLVFAPVWGRVSDRVGRKPVILISLFGTALGSLLTGLAWSIGVLFVGRVLDGASGASVSVAQAAVADVAPARDRARLMGMLGAAFGVGFVAGPAIGALAGLGGPHVPFFVAAAISFVNGLVAIRRLPETRPRLTASPAGHGPAGHDAEAIAAAPALDGPGIAEPAHLATPNPIEVAVIVRLIVVAFVGMVAFSGFEATFALLAERRFDLHISSTAAMFTAIGLGLVGVQAGLVGPVTRRLGESRSLRVGLVANGVGLALLAVEGGWVSLAPALALLVVGQGIITPTLASAVSLKAREQRGEWLGWQQSAGGVARVIGPVAAGALFQHVGVGAPYLLGAALALVAVLLVPST
ncbi:MAG: MFS transporter [Acidimicrobiales bacterium]